MLDALRGRSRAPGSVAPFSHPRVSLLTFFQDNWQPALEELVGSIGARFSAAFDRLGCAGEVRIREDEDFDKWAIEIYVKFRDTEKLQLLTGERQSGGVSALLHPE